MRCFARWKRDDATGINYRDQTILQFGADWDLVANIVLLNPGSAIPLNDRDQTGLLQSKSLPFFIEPEAGERYLEFSIDRLMNDVLGLFGKSVRGGSIRLYNLFNLKNQHSAEAMQELKVHANHQKMFSTNAEIRFLNAPVIIASGSGARNTDSLTRELLRHISLAKPERLFALTKIGKNRFAIRRAAPDRHGFIDSYHPSFTFKYGNTTEIGDFSR